MIRLLLEAYTLVLIAGIILSYLPRFRNHQAAKYIKKAAELTCGPVRKLLSKIIPTNFPFDLTPIAVIVSIKILQSLW